MGLQKSSYLIIDESKCNNDGICAEICHSKIIALSQTDNFPEVIAEKKEECIECGHCVSVCPSGAIDNKLVPVSTCPEIQNDLQISSEQAIQFFRSRRSIRHFKSKMVEKKVLKELMELARYTPTGFNTQQIEWNIICDPGKIIKLKKATISWLREFVTGNSIIKKEGSWLKALHVLAPQIISEWDSGNKDVFSNAPVIIIGSASNLVPSAAWDVTIALSHIDLASTAFGLGACWTGNLALPLMGSAPLRSMAGIPENNEHFFTLMIGYPKYTYKRLPERRPLTIKWE